MHGTLYRQFYYIRVLSDFVRITSIRNVYETNNHQNCIFLRHTRPLRRCTFYMKYFKNKNHTLPDIELCTRRVYIFCTSKNYSRKIYFQNKTKTNR